MEFPFLTKQNERLSQYCTFGIGGNARYFAEIKTASELKKAIEICNRISLPYHILGKGSNSLFSDHGFEGLVILNRLDTVDHNEKGLFVADAGFSFSRLGALTARNGWSGLEFASGIPASVGGAVFMNAGANGSETAEHLVHVDYLTEKGEVIRYMREQLTFSYRHSPFQNQKGIILAAAFQLTASDKAKQRQLEIIEYRKKTQPLQDKSAGCIFRNPNCGYAGALIEQAGLKGASVGNAQISPIHANFIVNKGNATAEQVLELIELVQEKVKNQFHVLLESEVRVVLSPL